MIELMIFVALLVLCVVGAALGVIIVISRESDKQTREQGIYKGESND